MMRSAKATIAIAALVAFLVIPALAQGAPYIPPGNSAANQYTESVPSAGGAVVVNNSIGGGKSQLSPEKTLGQHTAKVLEQQGSEGEAVAALASEGATQAAQPEATADAPKKNPTPRPDNGESQKSHKGAQGGAGSHDGGKGDGGSGVGGNGNGGKTSSSPANPNLSLSSSTGGSGLGQIASRATLSSSGSAGLFLPLALLAALVWAAFFVFRRRRVEPGRA